MQNIDIFSDRFSYENITQFFNNFIPYNYIPTLRILGLNYNSEIIMCEVNNDFNDEGNNDKCLDINETNSTNNFTFNSLNTNIPLPCCIFCKSKDIDKFSYGYQCSQCRPNNQHRVWMNCDDCLTDGINIELLLIIDKNTLYKNIPDYFIDIYNENISNFTEIPIKDYIDKYQSQRENIDYTSYPNTDTDTDVNYENLTINDMSCPLLSANTIDTYIIDNTDNTTNNTSNNITDNTVFTLDDLNTLNKLNYSNFTKSILLIPKTKVNYFTHVFDISDSIHIKWNCTKCNNTFWTILNEMSEIN